MNDLRSPYKSYLRNYINYLRLERNFSIHTQAGYKKDLYRYLSYMQGTHESLHECKANDIRLFLKELGEIGVAASTLSRNISSIRGLHKYLVLDKVLKEDVAKEIKSPKLPRLLPKSLPLSDMVKLIKAPMSKDYKFQVRDRALLEFFYATGARVGEAVSLKQSQLFLQEGFIRLFGKGSKERITPVGKEASYWIKQYQVSLRVSLMNDKSKDYLFLNKNGTGFSRMTCFNIVRNAARDAEIKKKVSPHTIRHSFATHLLEAGAGLREIQEMLGHSSLAATQIYTGLDRAYLRQVHRDYHPRS